MPIYKNFYYPQAQHDKKPKSIERERYLFKLWIDPVIGKIPLKKISPLDIEKLKSEMTSAKQSPRSIQYALAVTRQVFNQARRIGYYEGDPPTSKVKWPRVNNARLRHITNEEAKKILDALKMKSPLVYEVSLISLHCGLRFEEIASLEWQDVNLDENHLVLRDPKNKSSRIAPITPMVKDMFKQKGRGKPSDLIFLSTKKGKLSRISRTFVRVVDDLGLNDGITDRRNRLTFHSLRHSFASFLGMGGASPIEIKEALGHKSVHMAMRYSHLSPTALKKIPGIIEGSLKLQNVKEAK